MKKFLSIVMIVLFTMTTFAQKEFTRTYTEAHFQKGNESLKSVQIATTITFNYQNTHRVKIEFNGKSYLYDVITDAEKHSHKKFGTFQAIMIKNEEKEYVLAMFEDEKYGTTLSDEGMFMWFR